MEQEIPSIYEKEAWTLTKLLPGRKPVGCKWVFQIKYNDDGTVELYKAHLVAKGYSQEYGTDYFETFAPVINLAVFRTLLSVTASRDMIVEHLNIKTHSSMENYLRKYLWNNLRVSKSKDKKIMFTDTTKD
ncbi:PREDICTED: uncharacterized mitochondrial protein AtMg00820-like [Gekko japonicus]|uniref:Uncharacterized mitochondrial protein AtMg00820-like n=1 Tax=Gekko japonicus TaxID=146911 RepID=A0ABM1JSZ5_GEKJA|nr:PREDICTED: uncharacterized mitochondrial protein AtMg00820-like [Gekko japonicus]